MTEILWRPTWTVFQIQKKIEKTDKKTFTWEGEIAGLAVFFFVLLYDKNHA